MWHPTLIWFSRYLHSCLVSDQPRLSEVLGVDRLAHKYGALAIAARARALTLQLTDSTKITSHLGDELSSLAVVGIAHELNCEPALESAWSVAMTEFREKKRGAAEMITLAEETERDKLVGEAYYEAMLQGYHERSHTAVFNKTSSDGGDTELSITQRTNLLLGMIRCAQRTEEHLQAWLGNSSLVPTPSESKQNADSDMKSDSSTNDYVDSGILTVRVCAEKKVSPYDFLGRLKIAANLIVSAPRDLGGSRLPPTRAGLDSLVAFKKAAKTALDQETAHLQIFFSDSPL